MSMPGLHNFVDDGAVWIGASWNTQVTWKEGAPLAAVDLDLWPTITFVIKSPVSRAVLLTLTIGAGITIVDADAGQFLVEITDEQSAVFAKDATYAYSLTATDGTSVQAILAGFIEFTDDPDQ